MQSDGMAAIVLAAAGLAEVGLNSPVPVTIWTLSASDIAPNSPDVRDASEVHRILPRTWIGPDPIEAEGLNRQHPIQYSGPWARLSSENPRASLT
jgi:hypothetical protein